MASQASAGRVRRLGAAREGVGHWKLQRLSAIANVPLVLWFVFSVMALAGAGYDEVRAWLGSPISASLMILLIASTFFHARLGLQVVVEDYVHHKGANLALLVAIPLAVYGLAAACVVSVLKVSIGS